MSVRKVEIVPYRSGWVKLFEQEKQNINEMIKPGKISVHHIGSTSVPGLSAKPIIDNWRKSTIFAFLINWLLHLKMMGTLQKVKMG